MPLSGIQCTNRVSGEACENIFVSARLHRRAGHTGGTLYHRTECYRKAGCRSFWCQQKYGAQRFDRPAAAHQSIPGSPGKKNPGCEQAGKAHSRRDGYQG